MRLPHLVKYVDDVKGGSAFMFLIKINHKYESDVGLLEHEREHVRHWYVVTLLSFTFGLLVAYTGGVAMDLSIVLAIFLLSTLTYNLLSSHVRPFRKRIEAMCFAVQLLQYPREHYEHYLEQLSKRLSSDYDLGITQEGAKHLIEYEFK